MKQPFDRLIATIDVNTPNGITVLRQQSPLWTINQYVEVFVRAAGNGPAAIPHAVLKSLAKTTITNGDDFNVLLTMVQESFSFQYARFARSRRDDGTWVFWWRCKKRIKNNIDPPDMEELPQETLITLICKLGSCELVISGRRRDSVIERYEFGSCQSRRLAFHRAKAMPVEK